MFKSEVTLMIIKQEIFVLIGSSGIRTIYIIIHLKV